MGGAAAMRHFFCKDFSERAASWEGRLEALGIPVWTFLRDHGLHGIDMARWKSRTPNKTLMKHDAIEAEILRLEEENNLVSD